MHSCRFVDDDAMLRKMFSRVLKSVAPTWTILEASNGETALCIVEDEVFDLIFVDQYM
jgi:response regulator of citrate/malate metabolism